MTLVNFIIVYRKGMFWHNPEAARTIMFSAFAVDLSIVAVLFAFGVFS